MEKQLKLPLYPEKQYPLLTTTSRGIFILRNLKEKLPLLYQYIMEDKR